MGEHKEDVRAKENAKKAKQLSPSIQYAIALILPNILNGAFWGFTDAKGIQEHVEAIKNSNGNVIARKLGNACLVETNPNFLVSAVQMIDSNAIKKKDLEVMQSERIKAQVAFEKFLIAKGKSVEKVGTLFSGSVGIYCVNNVETMTYKGTSYPAFRVDISTALMLLNKYGYTVMVNGNYVDATTAYNSGKALWESMILSPTKTGIFISIKSNYSADKIKALEKQLRESSAK